MSRHFFIESTLRGFARALSRALHSEQLAARRGLLQAFDPRVRLAGIFRWLWPPRSAGAFP